MNDTIKIYRNCNNGEEFEIVTIDELYNQINGCAMAELFVDFGVFKRRLTCVQSFVYGEADAVISAMIKAQESFSDQYSHLSTQFYVAITSNNHKVGNVRFDEFAKLAQRNDEILFEETLEMA